MNMLNRYKRTTLALMACSSLLMLTGCAQDTDLSNGSVQELSIMPEISNNQVTRATVASDAALNEVKLNSLQVQLYDGNTCKLDKTFTSNIENKSQLLMKEGNWKSDFSTTIEVKALANAKGDGKTQEDIDIWKPYSEKDNQDKTFLMSNSSSYQVTAEDTQTIPVQLARAAAKIVANLHIDIEGYTVAAPVKWQLKNYNAKTTYFASETTTPNIQNSTEAEVSGNDGNYTITTYSYSMTWENQDEAPCLYVTVPLKSTSGDTENASYKIPVRNPKDETAKKLARNTIYKIDATINTKGGSNEPEYVTAGHVVYDLLPWADGQSDDVNAEGSYLIVSPIHYVMNNVSEEKNSNIYYKSSDKILHRDRLEINEVYYFDKQGNKVLYKEGEKPKAPDGHDAAIYPKLTLPSGEAWDYEGKVMIEENELPVNYTIKRFTFTLENEAGDKRQVMVKQYPVQYVDYLDGASNKKLFVIRNTKSQNGYQVGKPRFKNGKSEDNTVSPAFMIATQAVEATSIEEAINHCKSYVENGKGDKTYNNWRLPTQAEIKNVVDIQSKWQASNIIDPVFKGIYWTANGNTLNAGDANNDGKTYIRCIRDLTPEEVEALDNNWE